MRRSVRAASLTLLIRRLTRSGNGLEYLHGNHIRTCTGTLEVSISGDWRVRLGVRTRPSQGRDTGSIPVRAATLFHSVTRLNTGFQPVKPLESFAAILCHKSPFGAIKEHFLGTNLAPDGTKSRHRIRNPARNVGENSGKGPAVDLFPVLQIGTRWHQMSCLILVGGLLAGVEFGSRWQFCRRFRRSSNILIVAFHRQNPLADSDVGECNLVASRY